MAIRDEGLHEAIEEGQEQRPDVGAVDVGIGHDDDLIITAFAQVKFLADARTESGNHGTDFIIGQDLVEAGFFDVDDLAAQGQDGLETAVTALLGTAASRIPFDQVDFRLVRILFRAVCQFTGKAADFQGILAARQFPGTTGGLAGAGRRNSLGDDSLGFGRMFFKKFLQAI